MNEIDWSAVFLVVLVGILIGIMVSTAIFMSSNKGNIELGRAFANETCMKEGKTFISTDLDRDMDKDIVIIKCLDKVNISHVDGQIYKVQTLSSK
jgi:hypothetical protein